MASVKMYRCTEPHWQGDEFVPRGTVVPAGDPRVISAFFAEEVMEVSPVKKAPAKKAPAMESGTP